MSMIMYGPPKVDELLIAPVFALGRIGKHSFVAT